MLLATFWRRLPNCYFEIKGVLLCTKVLVLACKWRGHAAFVLSGSTPNVFLVVGTSIWCSSATVKLLAFFFSSNQSINPWWCLSSPSASILGLNLSNNAWPPIPLWPTSVVFIGQELPHGIVGVQFYQITVWSNTVCLTEVPLQTRVSVAASAFMYT